MPAKTKKSRGALGAGAGNWHRGIFRLCLIVSGAAVLMSTGLVFARVYDQHLTAGNPNAAVQNPNLVLPAADNAAVYKRVLITPRAGFDLTGLKAKMDWRHEFGEKFSAHLSAQAILQLSQVADIEMVEFLQIAAKPVCGDGAATPSEQCGEPGLANCAAGLICENCKCVLPEESAARQCQPDQPLPYGIQMVNGGRGGDGIKLAILDTGVNINHPDLTVKLCRDATKRGIKNGCQDDNGHGTHVAGTAAANGGADGLGIFGVAPAAELWMIKVCGANGYCYNDDIAAGIRFAADQGANIISMSLSGNTPSSLIQDAVDYAVNKGVLFVAAAGNDGPAVGSIDYPAANVKIMAVGAINSGKYPADFSSRGINDGDYLIEEREIELAAPGVEVESAWKDGCYKYLSGTSMAAPHIAGLAARYWQGSAAQTRAYLQSLARQHDLSTPGDDPATGFGLPVE